MSPAVAAIAWQLSSGLGGGPTDASMAQSIRAIERHLLFPAAEANAGEQFVERDGAPLEIGTTAAGKLHLQVDTVSDWPRGEGPKAGITIYRTGRLLGRNALIGSFIAADGSTEFRPWFVAEETGVAEGDSLLIGGARITFVRILSTVPLGRDIGDDRSGAIVRVTSAETVPVPMNPRG